MVVKDANGCTSVEQDVTITAPVAITASVAQSTIACNGGSATVTITAAGGTGALSYTFDGVTNTTGVFTHAAGVGLAYSVTDANSCGPVTGTFTVVQPDAITAPVVTVVNNCGTSTLSTTATGTLLWSTGETTSSITVSTAGTYTVTQTVNGCTSAAGSGIAAPKVVPSAPVVTVVNNCGTSTLSTTATGSLLWITGETTSSITVSTAGTYTVTQMVNGCTSAAGSGSAAPIALPATPVVTVIDNCNGTSSLSTTAGGSLLWSTGATGSSIIVSLAGSYTVTQTVGSCTSAAGSGIAAPKTTPATPIVTVINNCNGTSTLSTTAGGSLLWSTGSTGSTITVNSGGTFSVTQTVSGCISLPGSGTAAPGTGPATPIVNVADNCNGTSTLSTTAGGSLLWSTGSTGSSIIVSLAGSYTVTSTVGSCISAPGTGTAAPKTTPATPIVTVVNNCNGTSTLSTTAGGSLLWSTGSTGSTITVSSAGTFSVTQTVSGCTSLPGSGTAAPGTGPATPIVNVSDNCNGTSTLSTTAGGNLLWSTGFTGSSIIVSLAGSYTVTSTIGGCISAPGTGIAAPKTTPATPIVTVVNNCNGTSTLSTTAGGNLLWSTCSTGATITVSR